MRCDAMAWAMGSRTLYLRVDLSERCLGLLGEPRDERGVLDGRLRVERRPDGNALVVHYDYTNDT